MNKGLMKIYKISRILYLSHIPLIPKLIKVYIRVVYGATIPYKASIGNGTEFPHGGIGVVIHENSIIGDNCKILTNVCIGGRNGEEKVPIIGNNVLIGTGAVIIGNVKIGNNCKIGANAVVIKDIPDDCTAVGVPSKIVRMK